jgi:hypothetical protein
LVSRYFDKAGVRIDIKALIDRLSGNENSAFMDEMFLAGNRHLGPEDDLRRILVPGL